VTSPTRTPVRGRPPAWVMTREGLGSVWPSKFSFSESFLRLAARDLAEFRVEQWDIDATGDGTASYAIVFGGRRLTALIHSRLLDPARHQDRIIATEWDFTAALLDGDPDAATRAATRRELPLVTTGRAPGATLGWSRANRSSRLFEAVAGALAAGDQPDLVAVDDVGYLVRTTSFAANGRNGMAEYEALRASGHPLSAPYHAQMLLAYVWREFSIRLVEHVAALRSPSAAVLERAVRRRIGVGNSSGVGLVPFLVRHPRLVNRWVGLREEALARIGQLRVVDTPQGGARLRGLLERARTYLAEQGSPDVAPFRSPHVVARELNAVIARTDAAVDAGDTVEKLLDDVASRFARETTEVLVSMLLEADPCPVDPWALHAPEGWDLAPDLRAGDLLAVLDRAVGDVLALPRRPDFFWYLSEENMEPRRGRRGCDPGEDRELCVDLLGQLGRLRQTLAGVDPSTPLALVVLQFPELSTLVGHAASLADEQYSLVRVDLLAENFAPVELMRFQQAMYGMNRFRPSSDDQLRGTLFQGAALADEVSIHGAAGSLFVPRSGA
jgi:hypothetical protein